MKQTSANQHDINFVKWLYSKNYSYYTALSKYKKYLNGRSSKVALNFKAFGTKQQRVPVDIDDMIKYNTFVLKSFFSKSKNDIYSKEFSKYAALALVIITGLRLSEVKRITKKNLYELKLEKSPISLRIKYNDFWVPIYHDLLKTWLSVINIEKFNSNTPFDYNLTRFAKQQFMFATTKKPPSGFGTHSSRYFIAGHVKNIGSAQQILNHKKSNTTLKYIYPIINQKTLNNIIENDLFYRSLLEQCSTN